MSAPVNVLAVMGADAAHAEAYRIVYGVIDSTPAAMAEESVKARAAVAKLIAAAANQVAGGCPCDGCEGLRIAIRNCGGEA